MGKLIEPIAYIYTDFSEKFGIPRQSGCVPSLMGKIVFCEKYRNDDSLRGLEGYSHIWVLFDFSEADIKAGEWNPTIRPPRLGGNKRVGVYASRSPYRPNSIGLSSFKLERIVKTKDEGSVLIVSGIDLLNKTPIYDIKPYLKYTDCHTDATDGFAEEVLSHSLNVYIPEEMIKNIPIEKRQTVIDCLSQDVRPGYQRDETKIYKMKFSDFDIKFNVKDNIVNVISIKKLN